jgi:hypothetical protein
MPTFNYSWGTYTLTPTALGNSISYNFNFASNPTTIAGIQGSALGGSMTFSGSGDSGSSTTSSPLTTPVPQTAPELPGFVAATWGFIIPVSAGERRIVCRVIWKGPDVMAANNFADVTVLLSVGYALDKNAIKHLDNLFGDGLLVFDAPTGFTADGLTLIFYQGDDAQMPDPDYVANVGAAYAPGHRGQMLIKLKFNTEPFGGRIPSFTAVIRDEGSNVFLPWGGSWDIANKAGPLDLTDDDMTATYTDPGGFLSTPGVVRSTNSYTSGKRYFEFEVNSIGPTTYGGVSAWRWGWITDTSASPLTVLLGTNPYKTLGVPADGGWITQGLGAGSGNCNTTFAPGTRYGVAFDITNRWWLVTTDCGATWNGGVGDDDPLTPEFDMFAPTALSDASEFWIAFSGGDLNDGITIYTDTFLCPPPGDPTEFLYTYGISLVADYVGFSSSQFLFAGIPELATGIIITTDINLLDFLKNSARLLGARFWESGNRVKFQRRVEGTSYTVDRTVLTDDILFRNEKGSMPRTRENPRKIPSIVELTYFADTIQFTSSVIQARSEVVDSPTKMQLSVPWVDTPDQMLGFATRALYDGIAEAEGGTVGLPPAHIDIEPADIIELGITDDLADVVQVKAIKRLTNDAMEIEYTTFLQDVEIERVGYAGEMPEIVIAAGIIEASASQTTQLPTQFALIQTGDIITAQVLSQTTTLPSQTATIDILENLTAQAAQTTVLPSQTATGQTSTFEGMIWNSADQSGTVVSNEDQTAMWVSGTNSVIRATPFVSIGPGVGYIAALTRPAQGGSAGMGIASAAASLTQYLGKTLDSIGWYQTGTVTRNDVTFGGGGAYTIADVCLVAFKPVSGEWHTWFKTVAAANWNNTGGADPATGTGGLNTGITADVTLAACTHSSLTIGHTLIECPAASLPSGFVDVYPGDPVAAAQTWSPTDKHSDITLTGSNRIATNTTNGYSGVRMTQRIRSHDGAGAPLDKVCFAINPSGISGQWAVGVGSAGALLTNYLGSDNQGLGYFPSLGQFWRATFNVTTGTVPTATDSDTLLFEVDRTANVMRVKKLGGAFSTDQPLTALGADDLYVMFASSVAGANAELIDYPETVTAGYTDLYDLLSIDTLNPLDKHADITLSGGNLIATRVAGSAWRSVRSTTSKSTGRWYVEVTPTYSNNTTTGIGNASASLATWVGGDANSYGADAVVPGWYTGGANVGSWGGLTSGQTIAFDIDCDAGTIRARNVTTAGAWSTFRSISGIAEPIFFMVGVVDTGDTATVNFGATAFIGTIPVDATSWDGSQSGPVSSGTAWDPTFNTSLSYVNGNRTVTHEGFGVVNRNYRSVSSKSSGKYYWEVIPAAANISTAACIGVATSSLVASGQLGYDSNVGIGYYGNGSVVRNSTGVATIETYASSNNIGVAWDADNQRIWFRKNGGNWNNDAGADPATNTGGIDISALGSTLYAAGFYQTQGDYTTVTFSPFTYTAPSGFGVFT